MTFIEILTPSDIAYVVTILKNAKGVWDQEPRAKQPNYKNKKKVYHLFTNGRGQKRVLGQSVWSDDGKKYYEEAVKNWDAVYLDDSLMGDLVEGWDEWLKANGADERVNDVEVGVLGRKDLYDVIGTWLENDADNAHRGRRGRREAAYQKVKQPSDEANASDDEEQFYYSDGEKNNNKVIAHSRRIDNNVVNENADKEDHEMEEEEEQPDTANKGRATAMMKCAITKDGGLGKSRGGMATRKEKSASGKSNRSVSSGTRVGNKDVGDEGTSRGGMALRKVIKKKVHDD